MLLSPASAAPDLVIVSLDTTRADALTCYGSPEVPFVDHTGGPRTPVLDALAAEGLRFERFYAHVPSTLSSHASMFTGRDPHQHGVVRNGYPLEPDLTTLAQRLQAAGYQTHAVIGAAALERGSGIERGFDTYDDDSPDLRGLMYQSTADTVVDRALTWAAARDRSKPSFLFVHLFDAHSPYEPPEPYARRFAVPEYHGRFNNPEAKLKTLVADIKSGTADPLALKAINGRYLGEVAWMDAQLGRLFTELETSGLLGQDALLVVTADHGEVLSESGIYAWTHGNNVSEGVMRVPLILRSWGGIPLAQRGVVQRQASMDQLAPTIEHLLGLEITLGTDFTQLVRPGPVHDVQGWPTHPTRTIFQEATRPRTKESPTGWNNLPLKRAVLAGGYRMQSNPAYAIPPAVDEGMPIGILPLLITLMARWDADTVGHRTADMPDHTRRALEALGYLQ